MHDLRDKDMKKGKFTAKEWCKKDLHNLLVAGVVGLTIASFIMPLSSAAATAKKAVSSSKHRQSKKVEEFQRRLDRLLAPVSYTYSPAGKPDPFQPFIKNKPAVQITKQSRANDSKPAKPEKCSTPLECMDVGQLRLVAIVIEDNGDNIAMAQDASGIGYILRKGMRIGYRNGHVTDILPDRVVVQEEAENIRGEMTLTNRVLFLHPEEK